MTFKQLIFSDLKLAAIIVGLFSGCGDNISKRQSSSLASLDDAFFVWGDTRAPELVPPGPGAGEWNSEPASPDNIFLANAAKAYLGTPGAVNRYGKEAAGSFAHYFDNNGADYYVSVEKLNKELPRINQLFLSLTESLRTAASARPSGKTTFSMAKAEVASITRQESENWYLAVAGFSYWISGEVEVSEDQKVTGTVNLHLWDKYDWDPGVIIPISTPLGVINVDQERVGEFHRQGLAKEFVTRGLEVRRL
jgi:hypothetical protein